MGTSSFKDKYHMLPIEVKASLWFLFSHFLQRGVSILSAPIFTRILTTAEYGKFSVFQSWLGIASIIVSLNLSYGVFVQGLVKFDEKKSVFCSSLQGLTLVLISIWTIVYAIGRSFWNEILGLTTVQVLAMIALVWTSACYGFWAGEKRNLYDYKPLVLVTIIVAFARPVVGVFFVINAEDKVTARIISILLVELIAYCWMFTVQLKRGKSFYSATFWKYALGFNLPLIPHYLSQTVLGSADRIMIERMVGESEAGVYSLAYQLSSVTTLFSASLMQSINPWMYRKIKEKREKQMEKPIFLSMAIIAALIIMFILVAPEILRLFAPKEYAPAIWIIPPVAMSTLFMYSYDVFAKEAFYYEKTKFIMTASVIAAISNILLNRVFIARFGYIAAAYTTLFCYIVYSVGHYVFMIKVCDEYGSGVRPYNTKALLWSAVLFLLCGAGLMLTYYNVYIRYAAIALLLVVTVVNGKRIIGVISSIIKLRTL